MPTIFLSHTSIDKPFVERLAGDLERLGIQVWYDKYEIQVGDSLLAKISEGLRESEYLGIVISKEAWESPWVRAEVSAAWERQMAQGGRFILPIYYRECEIPVLLRDLKYADFRKEYETGFRDLVRVFGIREIDAVTAENWRRFSRGRETAWKEFRDREFARFVTQVCALARKLRFSVWVGGTQNPYSLTVSGEFSGQRWAYFSVRMSPKHRYRYCAAVVDWINPNTVPRSAYQEVVGSTANEAAEYLWKRMETTIRAYGAPQGETHYFTKKSVSMEQKIEKWLGTVQMLAQEMDWEQTGELLDAAGI